MLNAANPLYKVLSKPAEVSEIMGTSVWNVYKLKEKAFKKLSKVLAE